MENIVFIFQIGAFIILIGGIIWMIFSDKEKNKYHKINFKDKKEYLCVYYLYGNKDLKSNIGVLSKDGESYLLETEDKVSIHSFSFLKNEVAKVEVKETSGVGTENVIVASEYDMSKGYFSGGVNATTFHREKAIKVKRIYKIKIILTNGMELYFESNKDPKFFFMEKVN